MYKTFVLFVAMTSLACNSPSVKSRAQATTSSIAIEDVDWVKAQKMISNAGFAEMNSSEPTVVRLDTSRIIRVVNCTTDLMEFVKNHVPDWKITIVSMHDDTISTDVLTPVPKHKHP